MILDVALSALTGLVLLVAVLFFFAGSPRARERQPRVEGLQLGARAAGITD